MSIISERQKGTKRSGGRSHWDSWLIAGKIKTKLRPGAGVHRGRVRHGGGEGVGEVGLKGFGDWVLVGMGLGEAGLGLLLGAWWCCCTVSSFVLGGPHHSEGFLDSQGTDRHCRHCRQPGLSLAFWAVERFLFGALSGVSTGRSTGVRTLKHPKNYLELAYCSPCWSCWTDERRARPVMPCHLHLELSPSHPLPPLPGLLRTYLVYLPPPACCTARPRPWKRFQWGLGRRTFCFSLTSGRALRARERGVRGKEMLTLHPLCQPGLEFALWLWLWL